MGVCLLTDLHCDPEGQTSTPSVPPTKASEEAGAEKQDANSDPTQGGKRAMAGREDSEPA